jgi:predicted small secreted protein
MEKKKLIMIIVVVAVAAFLTVGALNTLFGFFG